MVHTKKKILSIFTILTILMGMFCKITTIALAETNDDEWIIDVREELQVPNKEWSVSFSTELDSKTINDNNIYVLDSKNKKFKDIKLNYIKEENKVQIIPTKEYEQGEKYTLCIDKGLKANLGKDILKPYKLQFQIKKIDSDFFKIRNVQAVSKNMIDVFFTQPIDKEAEREVYYEILKNGEEFVRGSFQTMEMKTIDGCNNGITIFLKDKNLTSNEEYTMKILGDLISGYGVRLLNGSGDQFHFKGNDKENEELKIEGVYPISSSIVRVSFNKAIDESAAALMSNYMIKDSKGVPKGPNKVSISNDLKTVDLGVIGSLKKLEQYELIIKGITDKFKQSKLNDQTYPVCWGGSEENALQIVGAGAYDNKTMYVYFDKKPDSNMAVLSSYYQIRGISESNFYGVATKVYYNPKEDPDMVKLYLSRELKEGKVYKLTVSRNLKDEMGNISKKDLEYEFAGSGSEHPAPYVEQAVIIGNDHIKVKFNGEIKNDGTNLQASNYTLVCNQGESRKIIIDCSEVIYVDAHTLILRFGDLSFDENYILQINSLIDYMGKASDIYSNGVVVTMGD